MKNLRTKLVLLISILFLGSLSAQINNPRTPAEWEEVQAVLLSWPNDHLVPDLIHGSDTLTLTTLQEIAQIALSEGIDVYIIDTIGGGDQGGALAWLSSRGVSSPKLHIVNLDATQYPWGAKPWMRDRGPFNVYENEVGTLNFLGWDGYHLLGDNSNYDAGAELLANYIGIPYRQINNPQANHIFRDETYMDTDGGNFCTDGHGTNFKDQRWISLYANNYPSDMVTNDNLFATEMGITSTIHFNGGHTSLTGYKTHTDYYFKLLDEETILLSEIPKANYNYIDYMQGTPTDSIQLHAILTEIQGLTSCYGRPYKIRRVRQAPSINISPFNPGVPPNPNGLFDMQMEGNYLSYTNSVILNKTVIVPQYNHPTYPFYKNALETDTLAINLYKELMPGYNVIGVNALDFASAGGAIHCLTREIAANDPVFISHAFYKDTVYTTGVFQVDAIIKTSSGVSSANVYWSNNLVGGYTSIAMTNTIGDEFTATIPAQIPGTHVYYYIEATNNNAKTISKPLVAPSGTYKFYIDNSATLVEEINAKEFTISPNPSSGHFTIDGNDIEKIKVVNATGEIVFEVNSKKQKQSIDLSNNSRGIYFVRIMTSKQIITEKIILQ